MSAHSTEKTESAEKSSPNWGARVLFPLSVFGLGYAATALFGYYWILVDFASAPIWSVVTAFIAVPFFFLLVVTFINFFPTGPVIELPLVSVLVVVAYVMSWIFATPSVEPILLGVGCGTAATIVAGIARGVLGAYGLTDNAADAPPERRRQTSK